jgi:FAD:protein FMN transferase
MCRRGALNVEACGENLLAVRFTAMASPCEVLLSSTDCGMALELGALAAQEAWRVERKYSRYRNDSVTATHTT